MRPEVFRGSATAIITCFDEHGKLNMPAFEDLVEWQIEQGTDALVVCGTTGESSTLSDQEFATLIGGAVKAVARRIPVIAGTGSNNTEHAIRRSALAQTLGVDAILCVTPYYNKTTQRGLVAHFTAIAESCPLPMILYNVPSRTGISCTAETYAQLAQVPTIAGVKEASGDFSLILKTRSVCPPDFAIYSGNDDQIVPILALGGSGVISVLSNVAPRDTAEICRLYFTGEGARAERLQTRYAPLIEALFCETNPIPVKTALAIMGRDSGVMRLPLVPMSEQNRRILQRAMAGAGLLSEH
ncbi:MAG: 4-hydroxy-tetrahydrodipicolinate synthase [Clostridium sp. SCN 57-10]|nr:MAG: 4-hydroxy-tetrahydrodipicolinate synthase [Clostridium sp. SCN 57-10]